MSQQPSPHISPDAGSVAARQLAEIWRYKLLIPAVALLVVGTAAFWVVRQPKIYEAAANLEYDPNPSRPLGNSVDDGSTSYNWWDTQEFYETQNFILRSRTLAERVVRRLGLHLDPKYVIAGPAAVERAALRLVGSVDVEQIRDTRVVTVHVRDQDPDRAQLVANTLLEVYLDKSLEDRLGTSADALEWLTGQMQNLKKELETAELALYKFREDNDSLSASLSERQKLIAGQLQNYSDSLTDVHTKRVATEAKLAVLHEQLAAGQDPLFVRMGPLATDSLLTALREEHQHQTAELKKLVVTYGEAHPTVRAAYANLDSIQAQLRAQVTAIVAGIEAEVQELEQAEKGIQTALNRVNQQGLALSLQEIQYTRLDRERASKAELYDTVLARAAQTDLTRALRVASARILDRALRPTVAVSPRVRFVVFLGSLLGIGLGVLAAFVAARLDNKVRHAADLDARGVAVLGVLPDVEAVKTTGSRRRRGRDENPDRDLVVHLQPKSAIAECCRTLRTNITFQSADRAIRTLSVTSAMPREGKTTVSISLAITVAQSGRKVLLVDTDLRRPRLHRAFGLPQGAGITSILAGEETVESAARTTQVPGLYLLSCGPLPPNPSELLHTQRFSQLVKEVKEHFDFVVFDSPPLGAVTDPAIISTEVDGTLLVARSRNTTRAGLDAAIRQLKGVGSRIVGAVLNGVNLGESEYASYNGYYRGYYSDEGANAADSVERTA